MHVTVTYMQTLYAIATIMLLAGITLGWCLDELRHLRKDEGGGGGDQPTEPPPDPLEVLDEIEDGYVRRPI